MVLEKKGGRGGTLEEAPVAYNFTYLTHFFNAVCKIVSVCTLVRTFRASV